MQEDLFKEEILECKILIVEDDFIGRASLVQIYRKYGFKNVYEAEDGQEGYAKLLDIIPDLVVTDIQMPKMDGLELCRLIRSHENTRISQVPILVQTALIDPKEKAKIFSLGASDYLSKPVDPREIAARSNVHLERELMMGKLRSFHERVQQELDLAKDTQRVIFPSVQDIQAVENEYHLNIQSHFESCSELGGDCWGIKKISSDRVAFYLVDFCGHGVNSALNVFRLHTLMQDRMGAEDSPGAYLTTLNNMLHPLLPVGQFATIFCAVLESSRSVLSYAAAGSPPPLLLRKEGHFQILDVQKSLLGVWPDTVFDTVQIPFYSEDALLLYSDAVIETKDQQGAYLTVEEMGRQLEKPDSFKGFLERFKTQRSAFLKDDLTLVLCQRKIS